MIKFLATQERIEQHVTVDEYIGLTEGNIKIMVEVMSKFIANPDGVSYMPAAEARAMLGAMTIAEIKVAFSDFNGVQEAAVVPNEPAAS